MDPRLLCLGVVSVLLVGTKGISKEEKSDGYVDVCIAMDMRGALYIHQASTQGIQHYFFHVLHMSQQLLKNLDPHIRLRFRGASYFGSTPHVALLHFVDRKLYPKIERAMRYRTISEADMVEVIGSANSGLFKQLWDVILQNKACDVMLWVAHDDWLMKLVQADGMANLYSMCTRKAHGIVELQRDFKTMVILVTHELAHMFGVRHDHRQAPSVLDGIVNDNRIKRMCLQQRRFGCNDSLECVMGIHPSRPRTLADVEFSQCSRAYFRFYVELTRTLFTRGDYNLGKMYDKSCFMDEDVASKTHDVPMKVLLGGRK